MKVYQRIAQLVGLAQCSHEEWATKAAEELEELVSEYLPHGSGFDSGCEIDVSASKPNRIIIHTSYHHMDEWGGYCGWTDHDIILVPDLRNGFTFRVTGRNTRDDIKTYIGDLFQECLDQYWNGSNDTASHMRNLAQTTARFLLKDCTWADLKTASREAGYYL